MSQGLAVSSAKFSAFTPCCLAIAAAAGGKKPEGMLMGLPSGVSRTASFAWAAPMVVKLYVHCSEVLSKQLGYGGSLSQLTSLDTLKDDSQSAMDRMRCVRR